MNIFNLTQHPASAEQLEAGVVDPTRQERERISALLTFTALPSEGEITQRAEALAKIVLAHHLWWKGTDEYAGCYMPATMIGGAPYLMAALEAALHAIDACPVYAFSQRESAEEVQADGSIRKVAVFRHAGFIVASPR